MGHITELVNTTCEPLARSVGVGLVKGDHAHLARYLERTMNTGAREGNRTPDLRITSALLYRLSYPGG